MRILETLETEIKKNKKYKNLALENEFWDNEENSDFEFLENDYESGLNIQGIKYKGVFVGWLHEREINFLCPLLCNAVTIDIQKLENKEDGNSELKYNGIWLTEKIFKSMTEFQAYVENNLQALEKIFKCAE